jgi:hypothetical protein
MPKHIRTIEHYTCDFKCGHKADVFNKIEDHEKKCFCNPANKACRICANYKVDTYSVSCSLYGYYVINTDSKDKTFNKQGHIAWERKHITDVESMSHYNEIQEYNKNRPFPRTKCEHFKLDKKKY